MRFANLVIILVAFLIAPAAAEDWPHWRGPFFNGSTTETGLPESFSPTENVAWQVDMPGSSASTPIVWQDHVFISSTDNRTDELVALCYDRKSGKQLWRHVVTEGLRRDSRSNFAAPSPVTNGELVVFFYGSGEMLAFDFDGKVIWQRNIQEDYGTFAFLWTFSSSPLIHKDKLYLQVLQRDTPVDGRGFEDRMNESYLLALDPRSGESLWRVTRPSNAVRESREAFSSPIPYTYNGREMILIAGGDALTAHDPDTGEELWRWATYNPTRIGHWRLVPSPVAGDGVVLICAPKEDPIYAIDASQVGQLGDNSLLWSSLDDRMVSSDVPTPAYYDGDFFVLNLDDKVLLRVQRETGDVLWSTRLPSRVRYEASPTVADGKIYVVDFLGLVSVFDAETGKMIHSVSMDEPTDDDAVRATIVASHGQLLIRTNSKLYCIGN